MAFWLAEKREGQDFDHIRRFDPRFWTVNFPRPMVASVVSTDVDALRVDATFLRKADLAGLIWDSTDRYDHPLLSYNTVKDYSRTTLSFRWRSGGIIPLDGTHGPTLTIEGRDADGNARTWYVRLWNYAVGTIEDAQVTLPFSSLEGGFHLPDDADPVWPGDIDRMFISLVAPDFEPGLDEPLDSAVEGWAEITGLLCEGRSALIEIGDVMIPPHGLAVATGFDDNGVVTPARLASAVAFSTSVDTPSHFASRLAVTGSSGLASAAVRCSRPWGALPSDGSSRNREYTMARSPAPASSSPSLSLSSRPTPSPAARRSQ